MCQEYWSWLHMIDPLGIYIYGRSWKHCRGSKHVIQFMETVMMSVCIRGYCFLQYLLYYNNLTTWSLVLGAVWWIHLPSTSPKLWYAPQNIFMWTIIIVITLLYNLPSLLWTFWYQNYRKFCCRNFFLINSEGYRLSSSVLYPKSYYSFYIYLSMVLL